MPPVKIEMSQDTKNYVDNKTKVIIDTVKPLIYILSAALIINGVLTYKSKK